MPKSIYYDENGNEQILSSSPSALSGLLDTDITTPTANQVLAYDGDNWVNSDATAVTFTAESGYSISSISACCLNKLVVGNVNISSASFTSGSWVKIGKLSKAPTAMVRVTALNITNGSFFGMVRIETDGTVYFYPTLTATLGVGFSFAYMAT